MKTNICIVFGIFYNIIWGQDLDSLRLSYIDNQQQKNNKILALTREKKSWKWLSLAPNISLSSQYDPFRQTYKPMINIGLSLHNLSQYLQAYSRNRIEREKLAISLQDQLNNDIISIDTEIIDIQRDSIALAYEEKNIALLEELNIIKSKQYEQNQINLEEKIRHQMQLNNSKNAFEIRKLNYVNRRKKLILKLKRVSELRTHNSKTL